MNEIILFFCTLRYEFLKIIKSWKIYVSIALYIIICLISLYVESKNSTSRGFVLHLTSMSNLDGILVLASAMGIITTFYDDIADGFARAVYIRSGVRNYLISKLIVVTIGSFLVSFLTLTAFCHIYSFKDVLPPGYEMLPSVPFSGFYNGETFAIYTMVISYLFAIVISVYSAFGLMISVIIPNQFVAYTSPLFAMIVMEEVTRMFPKMLNTYNLRVGNAGFNTSSWEVLVYSSMVCLGYIILFGVLYYKIAGRKLRDGNI